MKQIKISKLTLNIGVGEPGNKLDKAIQLLERLSGKKPVKTSTSKRIPAFGIRPGLEIATKVTLRGVQAEKVLARLLKASENYIAETRFDNYGNFSFGVKEYIDIPELEYDPDIGIIGLEAAVTLERPGFRIKRRMISSKIGKKHIITKQEAIQFMKEKFNITLEQKESDL